jgi:hypothetical protein
VRYRANVDDLLALYETLSERPELSSSQQEGVDPAFLVRCIEQLWQDEFALRRWAEDLDTARLRHEEIMKDLARQVEDHQRACAAHLADLDTERSRAMNLETKNKASEETIRTLKEQSQTGGRFKLPRISL